ncbi:MAG: adenine deaminase [Inconstantimicrobium porci]|uniref:adenine deaminase n=1 Tax=Inconstantimicrobium porci TaxID=2652291 RepID=UPI0024099534|nr:adenine deaminase [Inconstantimicrobium porci]MDD6771691.1 adenine deaminase [Inconstantimicrobium porci]MDY5913550.1 adenine deaminase [Inconstantimicrobium porci]
MEKSKLKKLIDVSAGRIPADVVIKNCKVIDVYSGTVSEGDIAISDDLIAGVGKYHGNKEVDGCGRYAAPGFIDSHIHIESSYVSPEELGRLIVPHGTTTIIADPHEIANVCGFRGIDYMVNAAKGTALDIKMMLPSCVPATPFEHSGAVISSEDMKEPLRTGKLHGLGEFMNFPGVVGADDEVLNKLLAAKNEDRVIDGHSPGLSGNELNAYAAARIRTDHECATVEDMHNRIARGLYVMLRQGSACHDLRNLAKGVTPSNSRRCLLCADDCQPKTILSVGHLDNSLRMCVEENIDAIAAVQMATLNAAECYELKDRGAIAPGLRADIVLLDDLKDFNVSSVFIEGKLAAENGEYRLPINKYDISSTKGSFHVKDFSKEKLKLTINSDKAYAINILPGGVVTSKEVVTVKRDEDNNYIYNREEDVVKVAVVERHQNTGNVACALLKGYGIKEGAVALSIAHDSHNIIVVGVNDDDMEFAVNELINQSGGMILVKDKEVLESMPMPIGGLMSDQSGEYVDEKLRNIHKIAHEVLKVNLSVEPVMTLCFMSLAVIPELKLTDMGLFDVTQFKFISIEAE